jgi:hypothetical protein
MIASQDSNTDGSTQGHPEFVHRILHKFDRKTLNVPTKKKIRSHHFCDDGCFTQKQQTLNTFPSIVSIQEIFIKIHLPYASRQHTSRPFVMKRSSLLPIIY